MAYLEVLDLPVYLDQRCIIIDKSYSHCVYIFAVKVKFKPFSISFN